MMDRAMTRILSRMKFATVFILIVSLFFSSCELNLPKISGKIEKHPAVEKVLFIEEEEIDFTNDIKVGIQLKNGGHIVIMHLKSNLKSRYSIITEIGAYRFYGQYYDFENNKQIQGTYIGIKGIEEKIGRPLHSLKDILDNYDTILTIVESEYENQ
jgi:hypothetical protein